MSGGVNPGGMSLQDFMRLYQQQPMPVVQPQQVSLAPLGRSQPTAQGGGQTAGGQGQSGGSLPFLGQLAQIGGGLVGLGPNGGTQPAQAGQPGRAGLLTGPSGIIPTMLRNNGANGTSDTLANLVGFEPFGGGGWGSGA